MRISDWSSDVCSSDLLLTDIELEIDRATGDARVVRADNVVVQSSGTGPDPQIAAYVARYAEAARDVTERPVGRIAGDRRKPGERKRVVEGRSVLVSGKPGGCV